MIKANFPFLILFIRCVFYKYSINTSNQFISLFVLFNETLDLLTFKVAKRVSRVKLMMKLNSNNLKFVWTLFEIEWILNIYVQNRLKYFLYLIEHDSNSNSLKLFNLNEFEINSFRSLKPSHLVTLLTFIIKLILNVHKRVMLCVPLKLDSLV